jgi:hypothetical protein
MVCECSLTSRKIDPERAPEPCSSDRVAEEEPERAGVAVVEHHSAASRDREHSGYFFDAVFWATCTRQRATRRTGPSRPETAGEPRRPPPPPAATAGPPRPAGVAFTCISRSLEPDLKALVMSQR